MEQVIVGHVHRMPGAVETKVGVEVALNDSKSNRNKSNRAEISSRQNEIMNAALNTPQGGDGLLLR